MKKERKKRRTTCFEFFCARRNGDCSRKFRGHQTITARSATQTASPPKTSRANVVFRGHLQTSPYDVRITTKIGITCTYYREILTARALQSSRTTEYYVPLHLRTIEKRKDWIWIGFQSGPPFFCMYYRELRTIECTYYREMTVWPFKEMPLHVQRIQWIPSILRKTLNSCWPKTYGKKDMEKIWKTMGWSALLPKIKKRTKNRSGSYHNHLPPIFEDFGGVSTSNVPSYEWSSWQLRTRRAASVRMFDHNRERCTVCSQCAPLPSTSHPFSLMKKGSFGRFQPLSFDFISRNNGSWAF